MTLRSKAGLGLCLGVLLAAGAAAGEPQAQLTFFRKLDPASRLRLLAKLPDADALFQKAARGDVILTLTERGIIDAADTATVVCRLKNSEKEKIAATIHWVIEDGTMVKKGDRLVELDDARLQARVRAARVTLERARAAWRHGATNLEVVRKQQDVETKLAEIDVRLADLELKRDDGKDAGRRQILGLNLERSRLLLEKARATAAAAVAQAEADAAVRTAVFEQEQARAREIHDELKNTVLVAPQDGIAVYHVAERLGAGPALAVGEPVREGQILIRVAGLKKMVVNTRVPEALVAKVRAGQAAAVLIDAFAGKVVPGQVSSVATVASQADWLRSDVKVYAVQVALDGELPRLRPGMSADVQIAVARAAGVVRIPRQALLGEGKKTFCYVKTANGVEERAVTTGLVSDLSAEVKAGLKEGEEVLRDPRGLLRGLNPWTGKKKAGTAPTAVLVRSVRPPAGEKAREFVQTYGVTHEDLARFAQVPGVAEVVPVRTFPAEARRADKTRSTPVIATADRFAGLNALEMSAGRFLDETDAAEARNVVVLGSAAADELFPDRDAVGRSVALGGNSYTVVGVLAEQKTAVAGLLVETVNGAAYLPLRTAQLRFGERTFYREAGVRRGEAVQVHVAQVVLAAGADAVSVAGALREILKGSHAEKNDWEVLGDGR